MRYLTRCPILLLCFWAMASLSGCTALNTTAEGLAGKTNSASGLVMVQKVGFDAATQTPLLLSILCWGDYASVATGEDAVRYEVSEDASIFNSNSKSAKLKLFFASANQERVNAVIAAIREDLQKRAAAIPDSCGTE